MLLCLILIVFILCVNPVSFLSFIEPLSQLLQERCLQQVQTGKTEFTDLYSALLCGKRLPTGEVKKTFLSLGIIHLMVISGAHLIFLEKIWKLLPSFRFKNTLLGFFLLTYSMSAGLSPPVLRALFSLLLARINRECKLFWSPYVRVQISGLLCLLCQNSWFHSLSLQLSWVASMGMSNHQLSRLHSCALTFILILPIVSQWGSLHPLSIIVNWLMTPLTSCVLLPLSLLTLPFPFLRFLTDKLWEWFLQITNLLRPLMENKGVELSWSLSSFQIWIYIAMTFILLQFFFIFFKRKKHQ